MLWLAIVALLLAALPAAMVLKNLTLFQRVPTEAPQSHSDHHALSILIPARNEEASIQGALESILANHSIELEVLVLDDHSEDRTASIVDEIAKRDPRVRRISSPPLPEGWNGKQHACWQASLAAKHDWFLFLDADVRLTPDALECLFAQHARSGAALLSGFPFQETETFFEKLLLPLMHFVLLGYLPIDRMRASSDPGFAAGCGQMFLASRSAYEASGGHRSIASSRHDGIKLPRSFRKAGFSTDLFDASDLARCRMYHNGAQVIRGLLKNANEGIANAKLILPFSVLLLGAGVLPAVCFVWALLEKSSWPAILVSGAATLVSFLPRALCANAFRQSWLGVAFHPISILIFVVLQWIAFLGGAVGMRVRWRGR